MAEEDTKELTDNDVVSRDDDMIIDVPTPPQESTPTPTPAAPELVKITMGGREVKVTTDVAEAYLEDLRTMQTQQQTREADVAPPPQEAESLSYAELMFSDPDAYTRMKEFWRDFYTENPELRQDDVLVNATLGKNWDQLANIPAAKAREQLAELTQKQLLSIAQRHGAKPGKNDTATLEGGDNPDNSPTPEPTADPEGDKLPKSLGEALKERKLKRAQAARVAGAG
jgi:hypothetical protein